jgi:cobalt-zinc-cadmium efflux system membrane fusion protein
MATRRNPPQPRWRSPQSGSQGSQRPGQVTFVEPALRLPDGSVFVPKSAQRQLALRTLAARKGEFPRTVELNGRVVADPNAGGRVQTFQSGRIEAGPKGLAVLGQRVSKGQILAWLQPASSAIERGSQQSALAELAAQESVLERRWSHASGNSKAAFRRRTSSRRRSNSPPSKSEKARSAAASAVKRWWRRSAASSARPTPSWVRSSMRGRWSSRSSIHSAWRSRHWPTTRCCSPDWPGPARRWPAAFSIWPSSASGAPQGTGHAGPVPCRIAENRRVACACGRPDTQGAGPDRERQSGVAVPVAAVVRNAANESVVWVHESAERFVSRKVRIAPLDGHSVAVTDGLSGGERVVVQGAASLSQIR